MKVYRLLKAIILLTVYTVDCALSYVYYRLERQQKSLVLRKPSNQIISSARKPLLSLSINDEDYTDARSQFGTKEYWDDVYLGRGDFPADEYSWYYGWEQLKKIVTEYIPNEKNNRSSSFPRLFCPGIGNEPILSDLIRAGYTQITAMDYSEHAIERQRDLLFYEIGEEKSSKDLDIELEEMDARNLDPSLDDQFDAIIEKGTLDAIYLSGDGNFELAVTNFHRVLRAGGMIVSVMVVVPEDVRKEVFDLDHWDWIKDGSDELTAGCFVLRKKFNTT